VKNSDKSQKPKHMKRSAVIFKLILLVMIAACSRPAKVIVPLTAEAKIEDTYTIIWNGYSHAYRYGNGAWVRDEKYDYVFDVVQKRYDKEWKSVKSLHRLHPSYDGKAGERSQVMYFELGFRLAEDKVVSDISSSLGDGKGFSDREFRNQTLDFEVKDISSFAPYNRIRISQHYNYEEGVLSEIVELYKLADGKEIPFMKNEETAFFYMRGKLQTAPTKM
jgi:hypothetical protein